MRFEVVAADDAAYSWIGVAVAVGVESRAAEVGSDGGVSEPSAGRFHSVEAFV